MLLVLLIFVSLLNRCSLCAPVVFGVAKVIKFLFLTSVCEKYFEVFFSTLTYQPIARLRGAKVINFSFLTSLCQNIFKVFF